MKNNFIAISIVSLGICILIGSWLIADGLSEVNKPLPITTIEQADFSKAHLMTTKEVANYLGIDQEEMVKLGPVGGEGYSSSILPYVKIGNKVYYSRLAIDMWLQNGESISVE
ncbi:helix-turn-helix domain-containing protein [Paenisporosarcina quisquiliarum]|uniref:helix-turn-helix domain-containing protein n=1 Tax=Paenisporosarcina quisquiliarum TaxID=365346 RepID=UPI0037359FC5